MNIEMLKSILAVPTNSGNEGQMVEWISSFVKRNVPDASVTVDRVNNVVITKGQSTVYPCVSAHIDTVQPLDPVEIVESGDGLYGIRNKRRAGIGADDKAGVYVCLELLQSMEVLRVIFFAAEEVGCVGARKISASHFDNVGYMLEFDCPSRNMVSYTSGRERLFENRGKFIQKALPVLQRNGSTLWQHHPYSDVMIVRRRFPISCLNLSCGYYNWHAANEYVCVSEVQAAVNNGATLLQSLGNELYPCPVRLQEEALPPISIGPLNVPQSPLTQLRLA